MKNSPAWMTTPSQNIGRPGIVSRSLAWLAGGQPSVLAQCPGDLIRYVAMGGVLLTTACVAGVSATFAMNTALGLDLPASIVAGVIWAVMILNLDRMLVVSMRHGGVRSMLTALPRVLLAILIGFVISTPIVLQIFRPEIEGEIEAIHAENLIVNQQKLQQEFADIAPLRDQVSQLQQAASGAVVKNVSDDPDVKAAQATLNTDTAAYQAAQAAASCEFDGTCGTGVQGNGPQYREKQAFADSLKGKVDADQRALDSAEQRVQQGINSSSQSLKQDAQTQLEILQPRLTAREKARAAAEAQLTDTENKNTGLLIRLEALDRLSADRATLAIAHWALFLLFLAIEVLPVLVKLLSMTGQKPLYDSLIARRETDADNNDAQWSAQQRTITDIRLRVRTKLENDRAKAQIRQGKAINDRLVQEQSRLAQKALDVWATVAAAQTDAEIARWAQQYGASRQPAISQPTSGTAGVPALPGAGPTPAGGPIPAIPPTAATAAGRGSTPTPVRVPAQSSVPMPNPPGSPGNWPSGPAAGPGSGAPLPPRPAALLPRPVVPSSNGASRHAPPAAPHAANNGQAPPAVPAAVSTYPLTSSPDFAAFERTVLAGPPHGPH